MPFGMGFGELVLILVIVVVVFGATKLPQLGAGQQRFQRPPPERFRLLLRRTSARRWTPFDWLLVCTTIAACAAAFLTFIHPPR